MSVTLAAILIVILAVVAVAMLREAAIHGYGLPGEEWREQERAARERVATTPAGQRRRPTVPAVKAAGKAAGAGLMGAVLAAVVGAAAGIVAVLAAIAWQ